MNWLLVAAVARVDSRLLFVAAVKPSSVNHNKNV